MGFKDLFIISEDDKKEKKEEKFVSKFPEASKIPTTFPSADFSTTPVMEATEKNEAPPVPTLNVPLECAPHMESIMKLYETGFAGLNKPGIEFFEYFEAIVENGINNPAAYKMALNLLAKLEKTISKENLISQSQYYIDELNKVYVNYNGAGNKKREELLAEKNLEGQRLAGDVRLLKEQLESIKLQISTKEGQLSQIDNKYQPKIQEIDCKLLANNEAKNRILGTINAVVSGIKTNL